MQEHISILLLEDDPAHAEAIRRAFSPEKTVEIINAKSLKEFNEKLKSGVFDVAIMDMKLPDGNAIEALSSLHISCPIIVMTSFGDEKTAVAAMKAGVNDYIVKSPEAFAEMPHTIERALREWHTLIEKNKAEAALRESEERFRLISSVLSDYVFKVNIDDDRNAHLVFTTENFENATGRKMTDAASFESWLSIIHPEDHVCFSDFYSQVVSSNQVNTMTCRSLSRGQIKWIEIHARPIFSEEKKRVVSVIGAVKDITPNKIHELINECRNKLLVLASSGSLDEVIEAMLNEAENLTGSHIAFYHFVNADQKGLTLQNWSSRTKREFCKASGKGSHYPLDKAGTWVDCVREGKPIIHNDYRSLPNKKGLPDGHADVVRYISVPVMRSGKVVAIIGVGNKPTNYISQDVEVVGLLAEMVWEIVEIKQKEEQIRKSEENFRALFENSPISIWVEDFSEVRKRINQLKANGVKDLSEYLDSHPEELAACAARIKIVEVNQTTVEFFEADSKDDIPRNISSYFTDETIPIFKEELLALAAGVGGFNGEVVIQTPHSGRKTLFMALAIVEGYEDTWNKVLVSFVDVTERKHFERALTESERRLNTLMTNLPGMVYRCLCDADWTLLFVSEGVYDLTGYKPDRFFGDDRINYASIIHEEDRKFVDQKVNSAIQEKLSYQLEYRIVAADGRVKWVWEQGLGIFNEKGRLQFLEGFITDITDKKRAESEMIRTQKLESIGVLAGGIAHDFNNILAGVLGNISLARIEAQNGEGFLDTLADAEKAAQRAKDLTKQLLTFSRGGAPVKKEGSIREIVQESGSFVFRGSNIKFAPEFKEPLFSVNMDAGQISQVVNNLLINAMQAMPLGGIIEAYIENKALKEENPFSLPMGNYVEIVIQDHGIGIPEDYLPKIFDPYFTTKEKGSGLGLATSYSIIKQHEGIITVESKPGKGTTFRILLPASSNYYKKIASNGAEIFKGKERILIIDDEEVVRKVATRMLTKIGYIVETAADGREGVEKYEKRMKNGEPFHAVFLDLTIPGGMGGREAIQELKKIDPNVKGIVSSGYSNDSILANHEQYGFKAVITKPFKLDELSKVIRSVLDK